MLIAPKRLQIQTSNLASMLPSMSWHHDMTTDKISEREHRAWQGSRDRDNSTVQTVAMGQIPHSTERILVIGNEFLTRNFGFDYICLFDDFPDHYC